MENISDLEKILDVLGATIHRSRQFGLEFIQFKHYTVECNYNYISKEDFKRIVEESKLEDYRIFSFSTEKNTNTGLIELTSEEVALTLFHRLEAEAKIKNPNSELTVYLDVRLPNTLIFLTEESVSTCVTKVKKHDQVRLSAVPSKREKTLRNILRQVRGTDSDDHIEGYLNIGSIL